MPYPPLEQHGDHERQTPTGARFARPRLGRLTPHLGAAADELEKAKIFSRGMQIKKVFAAQKISKTLTRSTQKILIRALEIKTGFSKSVRRQVPNPGLLRGFPAHR